MKQTTEVLMESLLRHGIEVHASFVPKSKTRKEYDADHFEVCDWNKPSTLRGSGVTLNDALRQLHAKAVGDKWLIERLDKMCFSCKKDWGATWSDDDYNGLCAECVKKEEAWRAAR